MPTRDRRFRPVGGWRWTCHHHGVLAGFRHRVVGRWTCGLALAAASLAPCATRTAAADTEPEIQRVRTTDPRLAEILRAGIARSATLRALVETLQRSSVIVYISPQAPPRRAVYGELHFTASTEGVRYLRVAVQQELSRAQLTAMIAHELQHATEVAAAPEVVDAPSMATLYTTIGYKLGSGRETTNALLVAARVLRELTETAETPAAGPTH